MIGEAFLIDIIKLLNIKLVVAIGNVAGRALENITIHSRKIRHPSRGGEKESSSGLIHVMKETKKR